MPRVVMRSSQGVRLKPAHAERGTTFVIVTFFIFALFGFAALSLDVANVFREQRKTHIGTDAGALAGVLQLPDASAAIDMARTMANANGVTDAEIADGARNGYPGAIQVGQWDKTNRVFVADATPYNAIRVPARRTVPLNFGKVVGLGAMKPAVDSVAVIGKFVTPYGVPSNVVANAQVNDIVTLCWWDESTAGCQKTPGSGNWGKLDLCGILSGHDDTVAAITGNGCFSFIGEVVSTASGFAGIDDGFQARYNQNGGQDRVFIMPVTTDFPNGTSDNVIIVEFIEVELQSGGSGGGSNWSVDIKILARGLNPNPRRVLVE